MNILKMPLSALQKPERNVRMHTEKQLNEFKRSISMFGQIRPIVVDETNTILAGNGLYEALLRMDRTEADVLRIDGLTENQKKKLMLADNRIYGLGVDDLETFDAFLEELKDDLDIPGFDEELLQSMVSEASAVTEQLQEYGSLNLNEMEQIRAAGVRKERYMAAAPREDEVEHDNQGGYRELPVEEREAVRQYVVCPHCGEKVWL